MTPRFEEQDFKNRLQSDWMEKRRRAEEGRVGEASRLNNRKPFLYWLFEWVLRLCGLYGRGYRNFLDLQTVQLEHRIARWPLAMNGFRILQLSDLHIDLEPALLPIICQRIQSLEFDMAVITGDFWEGHSPPGEPEIESLRAIMKAIGNPRQGIYGVLGNHDSLNMVPVLEELGIRLLLNEAIVVGNGDSGFAMAGVDDPYIFKTDDVGEAARQCPDDLPRILLSHSPQVAPEAAEAGFVFLLSGHTHGGQICLPGGRPLVTMEEIPVPLFSGLWKVGDLQGYTTSGSGACHVPIRFNCQPEVVIHAMRRAD